MSGPFVHDLDPVLGRIGGVYLWWYGASYAFGLLHMHLFLRRRREQLTLTTQEVYGLSLLIVIGVLVGGRLIEVSFDEWPFYSRHPSLVPAFWLGGMASHGVMLGAVAAVGAFALRNKKSFLRLVDELVIPGALLMGMGRIGNFIDGQIVGSLTDVWWGVQFPDAEGFRHPVVLYDGVKNILLVPYLLRVRKTNPTPGATAARFVFWYAFLRIFIDLFRDYPTHRLELGTGQTLNIIMALLGVALLIRSRLRRFGRLGSGARVAPRPAMHRDPAPCSWQPLALAALLLFCLAIPSNWTQNVPARYGTRHRGLEHSLLYPKIDTAPAREDFSHPPVVPSTAAPEAPAARFATSLVAATTLIRSPDASESQREPIIEPASGQPFPAALEVAGGSQQVLIGTAIRTRTLFKVQVYAYGLYLDAEAARSALSPWRGKSVHQLEQDDALYTELLDDNFAKTLRFVTTRGIDGDDMAEAFGNALLPRLRRHWRERGASDADNDGLNAFRGYFEVERFEENTEIIVNWMPGGILITSINGSKSGEIHSPALCWALFDIYLGQNPVMKDGKKTLIARLPEVLSVAAASLSADT